MSSKNIVIGLLVFLGIIAIVLVIIGLTSGFGSSQSGIKGSSPVSTPDSTQVSTPSQTPVSTPSQTPGSTPSQTPVSTPSQTPSELSSPRIILPSDQILLRSPNGLHGLKFGSDGNFFTYNIATGSGDGYWSNYGNMYGANKLEFNNGNILITNTTNGTGVWESQTQGTNGTKLVLQDDSNLVLYNNDKSISYWSSWYGKSS